MVTSDWSINLKSFPGNYLEKKSLQKKTAFLINPSLAMKKYL